MEEKICPGCSNECPEDNLSCGRGRKYFGQDSGRGGHGFAESKDEVVNLLLKIGHTLHHGHGSDASINCLTANEREQLTVLLKKCLEELKK